ncbi:MAG: hypothetical protein DRG59_13310 [Deltaproteobacteria bacterium]|nr:MAG: hypothetical protein DRG59_13310 [Deltaproteobacteria bacterium]
MGVKKTFMKYTSILYLLSITIIYTFIATAISINEWFRWTKNALSDLGSPYAQYPWVFNIGLIVGGILGVPFMVSLTIYFKGKITKIGAVLGAISLMFLILIGMFPEGTTLHEPVSYLFFLTMFVAILAMGYGFIFEGHTKRGIFGVILSTFSFFLAMGNQYWSIAIKEIIGALGMTIWFTYLSYCLLKNESAHY